MKKNSFRQLIRWVVLAASVFFTLFLASLISVHAVCPIGGFELFFTGLFAGGFSLAGLFSGMVIIFLIMSVLSLIFRRAYCGYLCPMGALQEFLSIAGKHILPSKITKKRIPAKAARILRWVKYAVLISFVVGAAVIGGHWMIPGDPFIVLMGLGSPASIVSSFQRIPFAVLFFIAILVTAFFAGRLFCRFICPAGAWYGILSKVSPTQIIRNKEKCVECGICSKTCPVDLDVAHLDSVRSAECIGCRQCECSCPTGALSYTFVDKTVPALLIPVTAAVVFAGSGVLSDHLLPARGTGSGEHNGKNENWQNKNKQAAGTGVSNAENSGQNGLKSTAKAGGCGGNCALCGLCTGLFS